MIETLLAAFARSDDAIASGANALAVFGATGAAWVFLRRWWVTRPVRHRSPDDFAAHWFAMLIGWGFVLVVLRQGYWQVYYVAVELGHGPTVTWTLTNQVFASFLTAMTGVVAALHLRFSLEPVFGQRWWVPIAVISAAVFALFSAVPAIF